MMIFRVMRFTNRYWRVHKKYLYTIDEADGSTNGRNEAATQTYTKEMSDPIGGALLNMRLMPDQSPPPKLVQH